MKIIPELTYMTGITDEQRSNYSMMNVSYTNLVFLIDFFVKLAPTYKKFFYRLSQNGLEWLPKKELNL